MLSKTAELEIDGIILRDNHGRVDFGQLEKHTNIQGLSPVVNRSTQWNPTDYPYYKKHIIMDSTTWCTKGRI